MIYLATLCVFLTLATIAVSLAFSQVMRSLIREHARERNLMLNQILHLSGRTWQPPPSEKEPEPEPEPEPDWDDAAFDVAYP